MCWAAKCWEICFIILSRKLCKNIFEKNFPTVPRITQRLSTLQDSSNGKHLLAAERYIIGVWKEVVSRSNYKTALVHKHMNIHENAFQGTKQRKRTKNVVIIFHSFVSFLLPNVVVEEENSSRAWEIASDTNRKRDQKLVQGLKGILGKSWR